MIDVYGIGITLKLNDLVGPELLKLATQFEKLDLLALDLSKTIKAIGAESIGMKALNVETGALDRKLARANEQALLLERNLKSVKAVGMMPGHASGGVPGIIPAPIPGNGGRGGRNGHRGGLHGGNIHAGSNGIGIGNVGMGIASEAMVPLAVGAVGVYATHQLYESAKDYEMAFARFKTLNLGKAVDDDANAFARGTKQFGVSMVERMTILRDMHEVMGSYEEAKAVTPLFSRMLAANTGVFGEEGNKFDTKTFQALGKVIEMRGGTSSPDEMFKQADFAQKTLTGSAGLVTPEHLLAFMKTGGVATRLLSNKAFYEESAPLIQEMGGTRFGTALMSAHQNLAMGRGSLKSMKEAARLGIIDPSMIEYTKIGTIKQVLPGALKDDGLYNTSKYDWLMKDLIPAIRSKGVRGKGGIVTGDAITDDMIVNELNTIFSQRTAGNAFAQMFLQRHKIDKNIGVTEGAMGINQLEELNKKSPGGMEKEFIAAWTDFKAEFGKNVLPMVTDMLKGGAEMLREINTFMEANGALLADISKIPFHPGMVGQAEYVTKVAIALVKNGGIKNPVNTGADAKPIQVHTEVKLDNRVLGKSVTNYLTKGAAAPQSGAGRFDTLMGNPSPGMNTR